MENKPGYLVQLDLKDLGPFRTIWHSQQHEICPILKIKVPYDDVVIDHKHKRKKDPAGPNGDGLCRGVIQKQANALEGKIVNNFKRLGLKKYIDLPSFLRNLADYLENPPVEQVYIHPNEKPKLPKLKKNWVKKLNTVYLKKYPKRKSLKYPKSKKLTKQLKELSEEFKIQPEYLKE